MENNHYSRKRKSTHEHRSRHGDSGKHHKRNHHDITPERHARDHSVERSAEKRRPFATRDRNDLSGDSNYVRNWLAQTQNDKTVEPSRQPNLKTDLGHLEERVRQSHYTHTEHTPGEDSNTIKSRPKPDQERTSSDSSILKVPVISVAKERTKILKESRAVNHVEETIRTPKHRNNAPFIITSSSSRPSVVQSKQETFEKRARHKTREDRYDTKMKSKKSEAVEKPIKTRREKKGDRKKAAKKDSENLVNNFASNKIGQDRLTTRPSNGPGIFQNGRASSPPRRRGLPDLAFSEMEFLQRSGKKSRIDDTIIIPKSRVKEKRKAAREQDEIATFFRPSKTPIRDNSSVFEHPTSPTSIHEPSIYERELGRGRDHDRHRYYAEDLTSRIDKTKSHLLGSRDQQVQSNHVRFPRDPTLQFFSEEVGNRKIYSETADTIVTWSESQNSPGATMASRRAREEDCQRKHSATPDSVRSSIERTGIFRDTGIENSSRRKAHLQEVVSRGMGEVRKEHGISTSSDLARISGRSSRLSTDSANSSHEIGRPPNGQQLNSVPQLSPSTQKKTDDPPLKRRPPDSVEIQDEGRCRIVIEYYDPNRGWYRGEDSKSPSKSSTHPMEAAIAPILAPPTRQQMARNARIKRPSTTLPVIREASDESRNNSPSSISGISGSEIKRTESAPVQSLSVKGDMSGHWPISQTNGSDRQEKVILKPSVHESISLRKNLQFQHNQHSHTDQQTENVGNISRDAIPQSDVEDERKGQATPAQRNGRTRTPLGTISYINPNREHVQFLTRPPFRRESQSSHEPRSQHVASIPRSPLIRLPSLYVQQLEYEEQNRIENDILNESVDERGASEVQGRHFEMETYEGIWENVETNWQIPFEVEDVLENHRCIEELGPEEANTGMFEGSMSRPEVMGFGYENSDRNFQPDGYPPQDDGRDEYNRWDRRGNHYLQEPWMENQQGSEQQYEINSHSHQLIQHSLRGYRELDEGHDGNGSETISMQRFWRPNPQY